MDSRDKRTPMSVFPNGTILMDLGFRLLPMVVGALGVMGCAVPKPTEHRWVSQPNMTFSSSAVWNISRSQAAQFETGLGFVGGGQGAGCTSCK